MTNKTQPNDGNVEDHLQSIEPERRRDEARRIDAILREATGDEPVLWGSGLVGYGTYSYKYASGREGDWFRVGFAARKTKITLYVMPGFDGYDALLARLGKHKHGKSCLHINKLADVDMDVLVELVQASVAAMDAKYPR